MGTFLIQISEQSYQRLVDTGIYSNGAWRGKRRDQAQGEVELEDTILFYCTGGVPQYSMSLACRADVEGISEDKTEITVGEIRWFPSPLSRDQILELVSNGELEEAFGSCGAQGFNIAKLEPDSLPKILHLAEGTEGAAVGRRVGPLDSLIETKLEDYIVQNWTEIDFGAQLQLYQEEGESVGQQFDTREVGRIDLLCEDVNNGDLVVIELKKGRPSDEVIGQVARYMGWVRAKLANGRTVRGYILAPDFDAKLRYSALAIPHVQLLRYQIRFDIHPETV